MKQKQFPRKCDKCNKGMYEGYVINEGDEYYCSDNCLESVYTEEERNEMLPQNDDELEDASSYWTEWSDEDIDEDDEPIYENN
jgi:hypothetical protein